MRSKISTLFLAGGLSAAALVTAASPAHAAWQDRYGYWHHGPPPWAYGRPGVVYAPARAWVPAHWWRGEFIPGHWR